MPDRLQYTDLGSIFDNPFVYEDPCLSSLFWKELVGARIVATVVYLPESNLPALEHFSGRTPAHQKLCARAAGWLQLRGHGYNSTSKGLCYAGGISDVASTNGKLFVECGYTQVGKILRGLHDGSEMLVASYSFEPVLFQRVSALLHFETYLKKQEESARRTVERLSIALRYEDRHKLTD